MPKIIDGKCINSCDRASMKAVWDCLNSAKSLMIYPDAETLQTISNLLSTAADNLDEIASGMNTDTLPTVIAFSSEYEQKEIQMYLYVYGECTFSQIYEHLKTHFMFRGTMPPYITRSEVHSLLKQMTTCGLLKTRRERLKVFYSLTELSRLMLAP